MIRKNIVLVTIAALFITVSCKKNEEAATKNNVVAPDGTAVVTPELNPETTTTTNQDPNAKFAVMNFDKTEHDFGKINEGDKVETVFTFVNGGDTDLIITDAVGSCGCTVPEYPKAPVKPGDKGTIKVSFNSTGKPGMQNKTVTITANTKSGTETLKITSNVTPK